MQNVSFMVRYSSLLSRLDYCLKNLLGQRPWLKKYVQFSSVQLFSHVQLFVTQWTAARQASLSITNSQSLLKLTSIQSMMPSNHLILCCPLLLLPSIVPQKWKWRLLSHVRLFATPWTSPWNSPGQNTGVGSLSLLQGIFPTQESNCGLLHCGRILYQVSYQGSPSIDEGIL